MIVYADNLLKEDVQHIWKTCFPDDSDDFINFYFKEKYKNENTLVWMEEGKAIACLQMLPYAMTYYNSIIPTAYISGAATLPEFQNKGIMKKLLRFSFHEMEKKGIPLTTLIPQEKWLVKFYEKLGYTSVFEYCEQRVQPKPFNHKNADSNIHSITLSEKEIKEAYVFYSEYFLALNLCVQKSYEDFRAIVTYYTLEKGNIFLAYKANKIIGLCFVTPYNGNVIVKDLITQNTNAETALINHIFKTYPHSEIVFNKYCTNNINNLDKGMARIINPGLLLQKYACAHPRLSVILYITDNDIMKNNESYRLKNGICEKYELSVSNNDSNLFKIDINLLSRVLLGYQLGNLASEYRIFTWGHSYMSLMLE